MVIFFIKIQSNVHVLLSLPSPSSGEHIVKHKLGERVSCAVPAYQVVLPSLLVVELKLPHNETMTMASTNFMVPAVTYCMAFFANL